VQPLNPIQALASIETQCREQVQHDSGHPRCGRGLAELYTRLGDAGRARQWLTYYLNHRAEADPEAERMLQSIPVK